MKKLNRLPKPNDKETLRIGVIDSDITTLVDKGYFDWKGEAEMTGGGGFYGQMMERNYGRYMNNPLSDVIGKELVKDVLKEGRVEGVDYGKSDGGDYGGRERGGKRKGGRKKRVNGSAVTATATGKQSTGKLTTGKLTTGRVFPPKPTPIYSKRITSRNSRLHAELSDLYTSTLIDTMESATLTSLKAIEASVKSGEVLHNQGSVARIVSLRTQLSESESNGESSRLMSDKVVHDSQYDGVVPRELLPVDQRRMLDYERGVNILRKHHVRTRRIAVRHHFAKFKSKCDEAARIDLINSAVRVQRSYRKHVARRELHERMEQRRIQKSREDEIIRLYDEKIYAAAVVIQLKWRAKMAYKVLARKQLEVFMCLVVQRSFRCYVSRCVLHEKKRVAKLRYDSAVKIQSLNRCYKGRRYVRILKKIKQAELIEKKRKDELLRRKEFFEDQGAAVLIQYAWRRRQLWLNLRYFMGAQRQLKAVRLQQGFRLFKARMELKKLKLRKKKLLELKLSSCIVIQTYVRRYYAQQYVERIRFDLEKAALIRRLEKVYALRPRIWVTPFLEAFEYEKYENGKFKRDDDNKKIRKKGPDGFPIRPEKIEVDLKQVKRDWIDVKRYFNPNTWSHETKKAILIQKIYRGHRAKARCIWKKQREKLELRAWIEAKMLVNAVRVQASYRGHIGRKYVELLRHTNNCLSIQKVARGFIGRKYATEVKRNYTAAICIQKQQRGFVRRVEYQHYITTFKKQLGPTRCIQRLARCYIAKKVVVEARHEARSRAEKAVIAKANETFCRKRARLELLLESVWHPKGIKHDGLFQDIFKHWGHDNKIENAHFIKLFKDAPGIIGSKYESPDTGKMVPFSVTDLDLMFTKKKDRDVKHLNYEQFVELIELINATIFPHVKDKEGFRGRKARFLEICLEHFFKSKPVGVGFRKNLDDRSVKFVNMKASMIQAICRGFHYRLMYRMKKEAKDKREKREREEKKVLFIQVLARKFLARLIVVKVAEMVYVKYIDPSNNEPYWSNPRTKRVAWVKPKIFGKEADVSHPTILPHKGTEFLVMCVNCGEESCQLVCNNCDDAFCKKCFDALHTKGTRQNHKPNVIPVCRECDYQLSTKTCETCTADTRKSCNYCDVCHINVHRYETKDKVHNWSWLVQCCVECRSYAARWRCEECQDVYCTACFSDVHKRGTRVSHKCEPLTYYTPTIHDHYEREVREKNRRDNKSFNLAAAEEARRKLEYSSALAVQKRYRGNIGRKHGKAHLKEGRMKIRAAWRQRKLDDKIREKRNYVLREPLGLAPRLKSDSMEEAVLKTLPMAMRPRALYWISQNLQDEYWFPENIKDKKKIPKRGFQCGRYSELCEQALYGGVRMPGKHAIKQGKLDIDTPTQPLDKLIMFEDRVRIETRTYTVDKNSPLTSLVVPIDRAWRFDDKENLILYRFPPLHKYAKLGRKFVYDLMESQIVQMQLRLLLRGGDFFEIFLQLANRLAKSKLSMARAAKIKKFADGFSTRKKKFMYFQKERQNRLLADDMDELDKLGDLSVGIDIEEDKDAKRVAGYLEDNGGEWEERVDDKTLKQIWVHKETGEIREEKPDEAEEKEAAAAQQQKFEESQARLKKMRKGGRKEMGKKRK
jgi:hypothetical protein